MNNQEEQGNDQKGENNQKWVLDIYARNQQNQETHKEKIVDDHQEGDPQVGDEETLKDLWDGRHSGGERDRLRGVERCYSEDNSSGGE